MVGGTLSQLSPGTKKSPAQVSWRKCPIKVRLHAFCFYSSMLFGMLFGLVQQSILQIDGIGLDSRRTCTTCSLLIDLEFMENLFFKK